MDNPEKESSSTHRESMRQRKALVDSGIQAAQESRGVLILLVGQGKGKSSSAFGVAARSLGHGLRVGVVQFIKGAWITGERRFFKDQPNLEFHAAGAGFTWETQDRRKDIAAARRGWVRAQEMLADASFNLVILDELTYLFKYDYLPLAPVLQALRRRPRDQNVIITGRDAIAQLVELADTVSEVQDLKHAFRAGVKAQKGIEW